MTAATYSRLFSLLHVVSFLSRSAEAQAPGSFSVVGSTLVSAMMMFLGSDDKVYILDKAENNAAQINGHPAWGSVWDIPTGKAEAVDVISNAFCAAGALLPNSSWVTFGGNHAVDPDVTQNSGVSDFKLPANAPFTPSAVYQDVDGRKAIRVVSPNGCSGDVASWGTECQWYDDPSKLAMLKERWYATAESLADGSVLLVGGMINGGYINRQQPVSVPVNNQAENTYEVYPRRADLTAPKPSNFLVTAGGLNTYAHAFLLKSGKMFLQANISTITLDTDTFEESALPDMPDGVVRVYPASAGVAMLPLTPANNYNPTLLFCGGMSAMSDQDWGNYANPWVNTWELRASTDCRRITPEPEDGSAVAYVKDDDMIDPRTMGQFIIMPDGKLLMINGGKNGTAGYTTQTPKIRDFDQLPFGMSLAAEEVLTPAIYDPEAPAGHRWSDEGLGASKIPRLYHSSAILLPDGSVMIAGSNPGADVVLPTSGKRATYYTTYDAEIFYPPYFSNVSTRPIVTGIPKSLTYGGAFFNVTLSNKYASPNDAAAKAKVVLLRSGFSTHAMNMGQRYMQLNSTYSVSEDGTVSLSVSPPPPNANLLVPGPALFFVVVDGVPSVGTHVVVGSGQIGQQPTAAVVELPPNVQSKKFATAGADSSSNGTGDKPKSTSHTALIAGIAAAVVALLIAAGLGLWCCCRRGKQSYGNVPVSSPRMRAYDAERAASQYSAAPVPAFRTPNMNPGTMSDINLPPQQSHDYDRFPPTPQRPAFTQLHSSS